MKLDLLTNATVVEDAIRFVSQKSNKKLKSLSKAIAADMMIKRNQMNLTITKTKIN
jgi:hypothetical protein